MLGNKKFSNMSLAVHQTTMATAELAHATKELNDVFKQESFIISNPYKDLDIINGKQWVCKGKHQYRQVITDNISEWVCQCGKSLTSKS